MQQASTSRHDRVGMPQVLHSIAVGYTAPQNSEVYMESDCGTASSNQPLMLVDMADGPGSAASSED